VDAEKLLVSPVSPSVVLKLCDLPSVSLLFILWKKQMVPKKQSKNYGSPPKPKRGK
jgi:hypothetical protein